MYTGVAAIKCSLNFEKFCKNKFNSFFFFWRDDGAIPFENNSLVKLEILLFGKKVKLVICA